MGKYKWNEIGVDYELEGVREAETNDVEKARRLLQI